MFATPAPPTSPSAAAAGAYRASRVGARTYRTTTPRRRPDRPLAGRRPSLVQARRRRRLLLAASIVTGAFGCGLLSDALFSGSGNGPAAAAAPGEQPPAGAPATAVDAPPSVVVAAGDTVWSLAERFHGDTPIDEYVDALIVSTGTAALRVGDVVVLPR